MTLALGQHAAVSWAWVLAALVPYLAMVGDGHCDPDASAAERRSVSAQRLRRVTTAWNACWSVFSLWGLWQSWDVLWSPSLLRDVSLFSAEDYARLDWAGTVYVYSKFGELLDTLWLYVRHRPVGRLHWTHHVLTLLYAVLSLNTHSRGAMFFAALNYAVHTLMYAYYAALFWWPELRRYGSVVTGVQIAQFAWAMWCTWWLRECFAPGTWVTAWVMYSYYLHEFVQLWRHRTVASH